MFPGAVMSEIEVSVQLVMGSGVYPPWELWGSVGQH